MLLHLYNVCHVLLYNGVSVILLLNTKVLLYEKGHAKNRDRLKRIISILFPINFIRKGVKSCNSFWQTLRRFTRDRSASQILVNILAFEMKGVDTLTCSS